MLRHRCRLRAEKLLLFFFLIRAHGAGASKSYLCGVRRYTLVFLCPFGPHEPIYLRRMYLYTCIHLPYLESFV